MSATVAISELDPETRQRVLAQIEAENVQLIGQNSPAMDAEPTLGVGTPELVARLIPVAGLKAHPLSVRVYGEPTASEELLRSVREIGVIQPIVVDEDNFILAGTSRHFAAVQAGQSEIPTVRFRGSALEREWLVLESNRQRVKLASQIGREYLERFRLEGEFAKLRQRAGVPPKVAEGGDARDKAAKAVNLGRTTAERLAKVVLKADAGQQHARKLLAAVDAGEVSIAAAFRNLEPNKPKAKPADCPVCSEQFPSLTKLKQHARHAHGMDVGQLQAAMGFERKEQDPRHNQESPYKKQITEADKLKRAVHNSPNSLGWESALDSIRRLTDIGTRDKAVLMGLDTVLRFITGKHSTDSTDRNHGFFKSPPEWNTVDELISTMGEVIQTLTRKHKELQEARDANRSKFLEPPKAA